MRFKNGRNSVSFLPIPKTEMSFDREKNFLSDPVAISISPKTAFVSLSIWLNRLRSVRLKILTGLAVKELNGSVDFVSQTESSQTD